MSLSFIDFIVSGSAPPDAFVTAVVVIMVTPSIEDGDEIDILSTNKSVYGYCNSLF